MGTWLKNANASSNSDGFASYSKAVNPSAILVPGFALVEDLQYERSITVLMKVSERFSPAKRALAWPRALGFDIRARPTKEPVHRCGLYGYTREQELAATNGRRVTAPLTRTLRYSLCAKDFGTQSKDCNSALPNLYRPHALSMEQLDGMVQTYTIQLSNFNNTGANVFERLVRYRLKDYILADLSDCAKDARAASRRH